MLNRKKATRLAIWSLDANLTIDDIPGLLDKNYNTKLDFLEDYDVSEVEKTCFNKWVSPSPNEELAVKEIMFAEENVKYIFAVGQYEHGYGVKRAIVGGRPLPKNSRVFNNAFNAIFLENMGRVFCILEASPSQEDRIKSVLFGKRRQDPIEGWGQIITGNTPPFKFESNFYYWVFSQKGKTFDLSSSEIEKLKLIDVSAVSQLSDRQVYDSSSEGADVLASTTALSALGSNHSVYKGGFCLSYADFTIYLNINSDGSTYIIEDESVFIKSNVSYLLTEVYAEVVILIYNVILPKLLSVFNDSQENHIEWKTVMEEQRKKWALLAIRSLCEENNIDIEEIEEVL